MYTDHDGNLAYITVEYDVDKKQLTFSKPQSILDDKGAVQKGGKVSASQMIDGTFMISFNSVIN